MKRRAWKRIPSGLLALLLILQAFLPLGVVRADSIPGPAYDANKIALDQYIEVNTTQVNENKYYTVDTGTFMVSLDGNMLSPGDFHDLTLLIKVDPTYVESFQVPAAPTVIKSATLTKETDVWTYKVVLTRFDRTTQAAFPVNIKMKNKVTPEGYALKPIVELYTSPQTLDEQLIARNQDISLITKVDQPKLFKHIVTNQNQNYRNDGRTVYGGTTSSDNLQIAAASPVSFQYNMTSIARNSQVEIDGVKIYQDYGDGNNRLEHYKEIVITDTLPKYTAADGTTKTAVFDATLNPGWTYDAATQTVSYTVDNTGVPTGRSADYKMVYGTDANNPDPVTLKLLFPDAKTSLVNSNTTGGVQITTGITESISNSASLELKPLNDLNPSINHVISDSISFKLDGNPLKTAGLFVKNTNDAGVMRLDTGSMHLKTANFWVNTTNVNAEPMTNIVISDTLGDDRYYFRYLSSQGIAANQIQSIKGVLADGTKVDIPFNNTLSTNLPATVVDKATQDQVLANAAAYEAGTLSIDQTGVERQYDSIEIVLKPEYALQPGQLIQFYVQLGFRDPYHLAIDTAVDVNNIMRNNANVVGNLVYDGATHDITASSSSSDKLIKMDQSASISKLTTNNAAGTLGERLVFDFQVNFDGLAKATKFTNPIFIDLLPPGVTYASVFPSTFGSGSDKYEVTTRPNYQNSGREAVIIQMSDFFVRDYPSIRFQLSATINGSAASSWKTDWAAENENKVLFYADEWKTLPDPSVVKLNRTIPDLYDYDQDGLIATDENPNGDRVFAASSTFRAVLPQELQGVKEQRPIDGEWGTTNLLLDYDTGFEYKLTVSNSKPTPLDQVHIYDRFPHHNDTEYYSVNRQYPSRHSAFTVQVSGPVQNPEPDKYEVFYRTDNGMSSNPLSSITETELWLTEAEVPDYGGWSAVTAIYIRMKEGNQLAAFSEVSFIVPTKTPKYVNANDANKQFAYNNFCIVL